MQCFSENLCLRNSVSCVHFHRYLPCVRIDTDVVKNFHFYEDHSGTRLMTSALTVQYVDLLKGEQVDVLSVYEGLLEGEQADVLTVIDCLLEVEQVDVLTMHERVGQCLHRQQHLGWGTLYLLPAYGPNDFWHEQRHFRKDEHMKDTNEDRKKDEG